MSKMILIPFRLLALPEFAGLNLGSFPLVYNRRFKVRVRVDFLDQVVFLAALLYREPSSGKSRYSIVRSMSLLPCRNRL